MSAGTVDKNGLLWKSTQVGKFSEPYGGYANMYDTLAASAKKNGDRPAAGLRKVLESEQVDGFEKLVMAKTFDWLTYSAYIKEVDDLAAGMVAAIPTCRSTGQSGLLFTQPRRPPTAPGAVPRGSGLIASARVESTRRNEAVLALWCRTVAFHRPGSRPSTRS